MRRVFQPDPLDSYLSLFLVLGDLMYNVEIKQIEWKVTSVKNFSHLYLKSPLQPPPPTTTTTNSHPPKWNQTNHHRLQITNLSKGLGIYFLLNQKSWNWLILVVLLWHLNPSPWRRSCELWGLGWLVGVFQGSFGLGEMLDWGKKWCKIGEIMRKIMFLWISLSFCWVFWLELDSNSWLC